MFGNNLITVFLAALSAVMTFIASRDTFGVAGASLISGFLLIGIATIEFILGLAPLQRFQNWCNTRPKSIAATIGVVLVLLGLLTHLLGWASLRYFRQDFSAKHNHLAIDVVDYASQQFPEAGARPRSQQEAEEQQKTSWNRWLVRGATTDPIPTQPPAEEESDEVQRRLLYIESAPFGNDYITVNTCVNFSAALEVHDVAAFLMHEKEGDVWYKPAWKELNADITQNKDAILVAVTNPKENDRVVLFVQVSPRSGAKMPPKDQFIPSGRIGVR